MKKIKVAQAAHPTEVDASWAIVATPAGRYLQISTYGSDDRASEPKVSQTMQISRETARELRIALDEAFGLPYQP